MCTGILDLLREGLGLEEADLEVVKDEVIIANTHVCCCLTHGEQIAAEVSAKNRQEAEEAAAAEEAGGPAAAKGSEEAPMVCIC